MEFYIMGYLSVILHAHVAKWCKLTAQEKKKF